MTDKRTCAFLLHWSKRLIIYLLGLYCIAIGVVLSASSDLGLSPVGAPANVLYLILRAENAPAFFTLGICTFLVYSLYVFVEFLLLRRDFKASMLLQVVVSLLFGKLVDLAKLMFTFLPAPGSYPMQLLYLFCSIPPISAGVMLYLAPDLLPTPGEGMTLAITRKTGISLGTAKVIFDCSLVVIAAIMSLVYFRGLVGVREGTVICALLVGLLMRQLMRFAQKPLLRFVEREADETK